MDNDNTEPVFTVGTLPKKCYTDPQELLNDIAAALSVPTDNAKVIKGAVGPAGPPGGRGVAGPAGPAGAGVTKNVQNIEIVEGSKMVSVPFFEGWQFSSYNILYNGFASHPTDPDFDDLETVVSVGTIVPLYSTTQTTTLLVYLNFQGVADSVPDDNFILSILTIS